MTKNQRKCQKNGKECARISKKTMYQENTNQLKAKKEPFLKLVYITY